MNKAFKRKGKLPFKAAYPVQYSSNRLMGILGIQLDDLAKILALREFLIKSKNPHKYVSHIKSTVTSSELSPELNEIRNLI